MPLYQSGVRPRPPPDWRGSGGAGGGAGTELDARVHLVGPALGARRRSISCGQSTPCAKEPFALPLKGAEDAAFRSAIAGETKALVAAIKQAGGLKLDTEEADWLRRRTGGGDGFLRPGDLSTAYGRELCSKLALRAARQSATRYSDAPLDVPEDMSKLARPPTPQRIPPGPSPVQTRPSQPRSLSRGPSSRSLATSSAPTPPVDLAEPGWIPARPEATLEEKLRDAKEKKAKAVAQEKERIAQQEASLRAKKEQLARERQEEQARKLQRKQEGEALAMLQKAKRAEERWNARAPSPSTFSSPEKSRPKPSGVSGATQAKVWQPRAPTTSAATEPVANEEASWSSPRSEPFGPTSPMPRDPPPSTTRPGSTSISVPPPPSSPIPGPTKGNNRAFLPSLYRWSGHRPPLDVLPLPFLTFLVGREPVRLLIDSGAQISLIKPAVRAKLGLQYRPAPGNLNGVTGSGACEGICEGEDGEGIRLDIPGQGKGSSSEDLFTKVKMISGPCGQMCDGILGMPWIVGVKADIRASADGVSVSFDARRSPRSKSTVRISLQAVGRQELFNGGAYWTPAGLSLFPPLVNETEMLAAAGRGRSSGSVLSRPAVARPLPRIEPGVPIPLRRSRSIGSVTKSFLTEKRAKTWYPRGLS